MIGTAKSINDTAKSRSRVIFLFSNSYRMHSDPKQTHNQKLTINLANNPKNPTSYTPSLKE